MTNNYPTIDVCQHGFVTIVKDDGFKKSACEKCGLVDWEQLSLNMTRGRLRQIEFISTDGCIIEDHENKINWRIPPGGALITDDKP